MEEERFYVSTAVLFFLILRTYFHSDRQGDLFVDDAGRRPPSNKDQSGMPKHHGDQPAHHFAEGIEPQFMGLCPPRCRYLNGADRLQAHQGLCTKMEAPEPTAQTPHLHLHNSPRPPPPPPLEYTYICIEYTGQPCPSDYVLCFTQSPPPPSPLPPPLPPLLPPPLHPKLIADTAHAVVPLIIDTDMSIDVDDVGMLCAAHALQDLGETDILAVMHNTHLDTGAGAISAINTYYGRSSLPIGVYRGGSNWFDKDIRGPEKGLGGNSWFDTPDWTSRGRGVYVDDLVQRFSPPQASWTGLPDAAQLYRSKLAAAADGSITIVSVGFATNIVKLLESSADAVSSLDGVALVARKVQRIVVMGGHDDDDGHREWNFAAGCAEAGCSYENVGKVTRRQLELWPRSVPMLFLSFEAGEDQHTGRNIADRNLHNSPCDRAYVQFCDTDFAPLRGWCTSRGRNSWDPQALLYAVRGNTLRNYYTLTRGRMYVEESGSNSWSDDEDSDTNEWMLRFDDRLRTDMERELDELYWKLPALYPTPPSSPPFPAPPPRPLPQPPPPPVPSSFPLPASGARMPWLPPSPYSPPPALLPGSPLLPQLNLSTEGGSLSAVSEQVGSARVGVTMGVFLASASIGIALGTIAVVGWRRLTRMRGRFIEFNEQSVTELPGPHTGIRTSAMPSVVGASSLPKEIKIESMSTPL